MSTYFTGELANVAQVDTVQITADDVTTTYILTVGTQTVSTIGQGTVNDTAVALAAAWNADAAHPYFQVVNAETVTDTITLTGKTEGVPFIAVSSKTGGAGTIGAVTSSVLPTGPNWYGRAGNWSGGAVPTTADDAILADLSRNVCWGLDTGAGDLLATFKHFDTFTGRIGLDYAAFATSANGETVDPTVPEYRVTYLDIAATICEIGRPLGAGIGAGSKRVKINNNKASETLDTTVYSTPARASETDMPAVRLLTSSAGGTVRVHVRSAPGGCGIGAEPADSGTVTTVDITDTTTASRVTCGVGITVSGWTQAGGTNLVDAALVNTVIMNGGVLTTEGEYTIDSYTITAGTCFCHNVKPGGAAVATANLDGGLTETRRSSRARTWTNLNHNGGSLGINTDVVTVTNWNNPDGNGKLITVAT